MSRASRSLLLGALLALLPVAVLAQVPDDGADPPAPPGLVPQNARLYPVTCPPPEVRQPVPDFPGDAPLDAPGGTAFVLLDVDTCGTVVYFTLEKSSGQVAFDRAAMETTSTWRLPPRVENGSPQPQRFRVPVVFHPYPPEDVARFREQWRLMQHSVVALDANGQLPGYLHDPLPMESGSFEEILARVQREARPVPTEFERAKVYREGKKLELVEWTLFQDMDFGTALMRRRVVTDGTKSFFVTRGICGSSDLQQCSLFKEFLATGLLPADPLPALPSPFLTD